MSVGREMGLRIAIDARAYGYDWTGIGRYVRNLLRQVTTYSAHGQPPWPSVEFCVLIPQQYAREVSELPRTRVVPVRPSYYSLYEQTGFLLPLLAQRADLVHFPHFNVPILYRRPFLVTVHDLTRFRFPGRTYPGRVIHESAYRAVFRTAVRRSRRILAVSHSTKQELVSVFPEVARKVRVIYEGVDPVFVNRERRRDSPADIDVLLRLGVRKPYLLSVAVWRSHKNLAGLIRAFRLCRDHGFPGILVVPGEKRNPHDEDVRRLAEAAEVGAAVVTPGWVDDTVLAVLYRQAELFVVPSLAEGFGLPPLEAMASGTPVVATLAGSIPEVLGDAAVYADPVDAGEIADRILRVLSDPGLRGELVLRGHRQAARFSWEECGHQTLAAYGDVLGWPV